MPHYPDVTEAPDQYNKARIVRPPQPVQDIQQTPNLHSLTDEIVKRLANIANTSAANVRTLTGYAPRDNEPKCETSGKSPVVPPIFAKFAEIHVLLCEIEDNTSAMARAVQA